MNVSEENRRRDYVSSNLTIVNCIALNAFSCFTPFVYEHVTL